MEIRYEPFHLAWKIDVKHELSKACISAYQESFGKEPAEYDFWDFSTNVVTPVSMGIPTIGFEPGERSGKFGLGQMLKAEEKRTVMEFLARRGAEIGTHGGGHGFRNGAWFRRLFKVNVTPRPGMGPTRFTQPHEWCLTCATSYKNYG